MFEIIAKGGFVMAPLIICSVISLAVIIDRSLFWLKQRKEISAEEFLKLVEAGREKELAEKTNESSLIQMLAAGIANKNSSASVAMESAATKEVIKMKKMMKRFLFSITAAAAALCLAIPAFAATAARIVRNACRTAD